MTPERAAEVAEAMADLYEEEAEPGIVAVTVPAMQPEEAYRGPGRFAALERDALECRDALRLLAEIARGSK